VCLLASSLAPSTPAALCASSKESPRRQGNPSAGEGKRIQPASYIARIQVLGRVVTSQLVHMAGCCSATKRLDRCILTTVATKSKHHNNCCTTAPGLRLKAITMDQPSYRIMMVLAYASNVLLTCTRGPRTHCAGTKIIIGPSHPAQLLNYSRQNQLDDLSVTRNASLLLIHTKGNLPRDCYVQEEYYKYKYKY
jgi:hypothetical protein